MRLGVGIVIPTYNRARLVPRAIDSVLAQTYPCSLVIVDDGSKDNTLEVLKAYETDPSIRIVRHPQNRGQAAARNTGIDNLPAGVALFGILDSDDSLLPDAIEALVPVFESSDGAYSQVFGWCQDMHTGEPTGKMSHREGLVTYDDALAGRFKGEFWQLARLDILGDLRFDERARGGARGVWWLMLRQKPAWLVGNVVRNYDRSGTDRVSLRGYSRAAAPATQWAVKTFMDGQIGRDMLARYPRRYAGYQTELVKWAVLAGDHAGARAAAREAWRVAPSRRALKMLIVAHLPTFVARNLANSKRAVTRVARSLLARHRARGAHDRIGGAST
jgi:glycosyltransferase involved in cell wall biosynthesis